MTGLTANRHVWIIFATLVATFGGCAWGCHSAPPVAASQPATLRLLTYNIHADVPITDESIRAIRESDADLTALQEVRSDAEARLRSEFRTKYPHILAHSTSGGWDGLMLMSKWPLRDVKFLEKAPNAWFPAWAVAMRTPSGEVQVLTVHLRPRIGNSGGVIVGHFTAGPMHRHEIESHFGALAPDRPTIVLGDFNEKDDEPAIVFLEAHGLMNVLPLFDTTSNTFSSSYYGFPVKGRVDHILFSRHFRAVAAEVVQNRGSDHFPLTATLELANGH